MPGTLMQMPYAISLVLAPTPHNPAALPGGDAPAFRARMTNWSHTSPLPQDARPAAPPAAVVLPRLSSRFGYRHDPVRGGWAMHSGIDIPGPLGSEVRAAEAGTIRFTGVAGGYGNMIEIAHAGGTATRYGHLSRMLVRAGARVEQGDVIALMGSTGRSTGSHLHFEVRLYGQPTDPLAQFSTVRAPDQAPPATTTEPYLSRYARARLPRE